MLVNLRIKNLKRMIIIPIRMDTQNKKTTSEEVAHYFRE